MVGSPGGNTVIATTGPVFLRSTHSGSFIAAGLPAKGIRYSPGGIAIGRSAAATCSSSGSRSKSVRW